MAPDGHWLRNVINLCRWKIDLRKPARNINLFRRVCPVIHTPRDANDLLTFVEGIGSEGLDPADYGADALRQAIAGGGAALDTAATDTFVKVASDLAAKGISREQVAQKLQECLHQALAQLEAASRQA